MKIKSGVIPSSRDTRDYGVRVMATAFPDSFLFNDPIPMWNQGGYSHCVMYALRWIVARTLASSGEFDDKLGTTYGYGSWRSIPLMGMIPSEAANGFIKEGIPLSTVDSKLLEMPDAAKYAAQYQARMLISAEPYKGWTWARLHTEAEIKGALIQANKTGGGVMFTHSCYSGAPDKWGMWGTATPQVILHQMPIIGWEPRQVNPSKTEECVKVRNSYGSNWGKFGGYCWMRWTDVLACDDVIALFPPAGSIETDTPTEEKPIVEVIVTIKKGDKGDEVKAIQERLIVHGYASYLGSYGADGSFGSKTESAIKAFQTANKLEPTGIVDKNTLIALEAEPTETPKEDPEAPSDFAAGLVTWCHEKIGSAYVWGGNGQTNLTDSQIRSMDTSITNAARSIAYIKALKDSGVSAYECFDCSGLISRYMQNNGKVYQKRNCDHLWAMCTHLTAVDPAILIAGDLLFRGSDGDKYHVGVYVGDGWVIESRGRSYGVVKRGINASGISYWKYAGRLKI